MARKERERKDKRKDKEKDERDALDERVVHIARDRKSVV